MNLPALNQVMRFEGEQKISKLKQKEFVRFVRGGFSFF
jgi:hypothetical protein